MKGTLKQVTQAYPWNYLTHFCIHTVHSHIHTLLKYRQILYLRLLGNFPWAHVWEVSLGPFITLPHRYHLLIHSKGMRPAFERLYLFPVVNLSLQHIHVLLNLDTQLYGFKQNRALFLVVSQERQLEGVHNHLNASLSRSCILGTICAITLWKVKCVKCEFTQWSPWLQANWLYVTVLTKEHKRSSAIYCLTIY